MSATIDLQGTYTYRHRHHPAGTVENHSGEYSSFTVADDQGSKVTFYFTSRAAIRDFAKAAIAAQVPWGTVADPDADES